MSKAKKVWIIVAASCIALGLIISAAVAAVNGLDELMNTEEEVTNEYSVSEDFKNIYIDTTEYDVRFMSSDDNACKVVCSGRGKESHRVYAENSTLKIIRKNEHRWFFFNGFSNSESVINIYLPENEYEKLYISSVSGNIYVPSGFVFDNADLNSTSGEVYFIGKTKSVMTAETVSGDLNIANAEGKLNAGTTSGEITVLNSALQSADIETTSGDSEIRNVTAAGKFSVESTSGEVEFTGDAGEIKIETVSGDVKGTAMTMKHFVTHTVSGDVNVPDSDSLAPKCEINTTSGDIYFKVNKEV